MMLWLEPFHRVVPDEAPLGVTYANILRDSDPTQSSEIIHRFLASELIHDAEFHVQICYDICVSAVLTDEPDHIKKALPYALLIPTTESQDTKKMAVEALVMIAKRCNQYCQQQRREPSGDIVLAQEHVDYLLDTLIPIKTPTLPASYNSLGAALCFADRHLEGSKAYRKVLAHPLCSRHQARDLKQNLILAQMAAWPGMPSHDMTMLSQQSPTMVLCIPNSQRETSLHNGARGER